MDKDEISTKLVEIKTSGFALYLFLCLLVIPYFLLVMVTIEAFSVTLLFPINLVGGFVAIPVCIFCTYFVSKYCECNRIILTISELIVITDFPGQKINKNKYEEIMLGEIDHIFLGCIKDPPNWSSPRIRYGGVYSVAVKFAPYLVVFEKSGEKHIFSTKPYSKASFRRLIDELRGMGMIVQVEHNLL